METYHYNDLWKSRNKTFQYTMLSVFRRILREKPRSISYCKKLMCEYMNKKKHTDKELVEYVRVILLRENPSYLRPSLLCKKNRGESRVEDIRKYLVPSMHRYLDMGSMDGVITMSVCSYLSWLRCQTIQNDGRENDTWVSGVGVDCDIYPIQHSPDLLVDSFQSSFTYSKELGSTVANLRKPNNSLDFIQYDGVSLQITDESFDLITSFMTLHHVEHLSEHLKEIYRLLAPGGKWIIREHNVSSPEVGYAVNFQHECYDPEFDVNMSIHQCHSRNEWIQLCLSVGFHLEFVTPLNQCHSRWITTGRNRSRRCVRNPFHSFYMVFNKDSIPSSLSSTNALSSSSESPVI
jgi:SAM-dependent methyltransferase